jgi:hypothetical protein
LNNNKADEDVEDELRRQLFEAQQFYAGGYASPKNR